MDPEQQQQHNQTCDVHRQGSSGSSPGNGEQSRLKCIHTLHTKGPPLANDKYQLCPLCPPLDLYICQEPVRVAGSLEKILASDSAGVNNPPDTDCTIVIDQDNSKASLKLQECSTAAASLDKPSKEAPVKVFSVEAVSCKDTGFDPFPAPHLSQPLTGAQVLRPAQPQAQPSRPRTHYVDWLRVFLTVLVVVHHCVVAYQSSYAWAAKRGDTALFLFSELFVVGNQAYFMTLFFFISGLYVPGSYRRKGPARFLLDRTLRLVVPCIFYSFLAPPFILWWSEMARQPTADPAAVLAAQFKAWLKPAWPSSYNIATGPPWFVWMLWCFNVAHVIVNAMAGCNRVQHMWRKLCRRNDQRLPQPANQLSTFSTQAMLRHTSILTAIMVTVCFATRVLDKFAFGVNPLQFYQRGPFVSFMPDLFPTYAIAFALGIFSGPSRWNVLARLPDSWASWGLWCSGCWWFWAGWLLNIALRPAMTMQRGVAAWLFSWLLRTFVEQSFCVVWSVGLLVVFRLAYNAKPSMLGRYVIDAAYGVYLVHPVILILFARLFMKYPFPSAVVNAAIISPLSVITSWLLAVLMRMLPGANHVL